jgi:hypothetical protein
MDEMSLNEEGNMVTMVKRAEPTASGDPGGCTS